MNSLAVYWELFGITAELSAREDRRSGGVMDAIAAQCGSENGSDSSQRDDETDDETDGTSAFRPDISATGHAATPPFTWETALVGDVFAGDSLSVLCRRGTRVGTAPEHLEHAAAAIRQLADWMQVFQAAPPQRRARQMHRETRIDIIVRRLQGCGARGVLDAECVAHAQQVLTNYRQIAPLASERSVPANACIALDHFVFAAGQLHGGDGAGCHAAPATFDIARLWVELDRLKSIPYIAAAKVDYLQGEFLRRFATYALFDRREFAFHCLEMAVQEAASHGQCRTSSSLVGATLLKRYYRRVVAACAYSLALSLASSVSPSRPVLSSPSPSPSSSPSPSPSPSLSPPPSTSGGQPIEVDSETIIARLRERIGDYFPALAGSDVVIESLPFRERSSYPVYLYGVRNGTEPGFAAKVVVKFAPVAAENNEGLTEYTNLRLMTPVLAACDAGVGVARPLDFFADINVLVSEYVPHERFSRWFLRTNSVVADHATRRDLSDLIARAGKWLHIFHDTTRQAVGPLSQTRCLSDFETLLGILDRAGLPAKVVAELDGFITRISGPVSGLEAPVALIHGDYGLQNMGISDSKLYVFDLQYKTHDVVYADICYFLVTMETMNPLPDHPLFSRKRAIALQDEFLAGYFGAQHQWSVEEQILLRVYYLQHLMRRLIKQATNVNSSGNSLRKSIFGQYFVKWNYPRRFRSQMVRIERLLHEAGGYGGSGPTAV